MYFGNSYLFISKFNKMNAFLFSAVSFIASLYFVFLFVRLGDTDNNVLLQFNENQNEF